MKNQLTFFSSQIWNFGHEFHEKWTFGNAPLMLIAHAHLTIYNYSHCISEKIYG